MKKLLLSLLLVLPLCGFAQKGMQGVGVNLGYGAGWGGASAANSCLNYQIHLSNRFRLSPSIGFYYVEFDEGDWGFDYSQRYYLFSADAHYFFDQPRRLRPYAIGGLLFGLGNGYLSSVVGGVKLGLGLDYRLGYHFSLRLETPLYLDAIYGNHTFLPTLGLTYTF